MSTHGTHAWLVVEDVDGKTSLDLATDTMVDLCVRLSLEGQGSECEIHLTPGQAERVAVHLQECAAKVREQTPEHLLSHAARTVEYEVDFTTPPSDTWPC